MFKHIIFATGFLLTLFNPISCLAYKPALHQAFTESAEYYSTINQRLIDLGSEFSSSTLAYKRLKPIHQSPPIDTDFENTVGNYLEVLKFGALWEDDSTRVKLANGTWYIRQPIQARPFNHFFDTQNLRPLTVELPIILGGGYPAIPYGDIGMTSPDWILEDAKDVDPNFNLYPLQAELAIGVQEYSYYDARQYFLLGLTENSYSARNQNIQMMFQSLGHVLHHIQDMGQPQHVRNDLHCDACGVFNDLSKYEILTGSDANIQRIRGAGLLNKNSFSTAPVVLDLPRQYWVSGTTAKWGMAEYTSENFISTESSYLSKTYQSPNTSYAIQNASTNSKYPKPSAQGLTVSSPITLQELNRETIMPIDDKDLVDRVAGGAKFYFVGRTISDPYPGRVGYDLHNPRHATLGFFSYKIGHRDTNSVHPAVITENHFTYESKLKFLFPRITAFSSGFLDYFFRGSIELYQNNGQWFIRNTTALGNDRTMEGTFRIFAQNQAGERSQLSSQQLLLPSGNVSPAFNLAVPAGNVALIAVFNGRLGQEGSGNRLFAVAGDYVSHTTPSPVMCGSAISQYGGQGTRSYTIALGGNAGRVEIEFDAFTIPDELRVTLDDGRVLYNSGGLVSGYRLERKSFDPLGKTNVIATARVNAPTSGTAWTMTIGCPGQELSNSQRQLDRYTPSFAFSNTSCDVDFSIDGAYVGKSNRASPRTFNPVLTQGAHSYTASHSNCLGPFKATLKMTFGGSTESLPVISGSFSLGSTPSIPGATTW